MEIPIRTLHLFSKLDEKLITLLKSLSKEEWNYPTVAKLWTVKDIASHLLDGNLRVISIMRDQFVGDPSGQINSYQDLLDYLNRLNADWVTASRRLSPGVLIQWLENTGPEYVRCLAALEPFDTAIFSVAWAGESESKNWFHTAREYTEKWHHQQQIREAVGRQGIMDREFFFPLIDTFMRALPHTYRHTEAPEGTHIKISVTSDAGGTWSLLKTTNTWSLTSSDSSPIAEITLDPDTAWKLFTKALRGEEAKEKIQFSGDANLCNPILSMLAVMA